MSESINSQSIKINEQGAAKAFFWICAVVIIVLVAGAFAVIGGNKSSSSDNTSEAPTAAPSLPEENGKQVINMTAKGGYKPGSVTAKAGQPVLLKIATSNTLDCSNAFTIPELKISKNLPRTGETVVEIPAQEPGKVLKAACSMGMYSFTMKFI